MKTDPTIKEKERDVDSITDTAMPHPVGTGIGAAAGAMTGAVAGIPGGPVGMAAGAVVGAVAGGALGKATAATISPTEEDLYWQENHPSQEYGAGDEDFTYEDFKPAYRLGWEGPARYGTNFEAANSAMRTDWEERRGSSRLDWNQAEPAVRAAWERAQSRAELA